MTVDTIKRGIINGIRTTWELAEIIFPVYVLVTILRYTPLFPYLSQILTPVLRVFGLPGEASIALVLGAFVNVYAAIGAMTALSLSIKEVTILGTMVAICHSLINETAVTKKVGVPITSIVLTRVTIAAFMGIILNVIM
ncbi:nucleoside recognition domain-containing protein [Calorimonas adulescens]|uniref:Nucleoside recognition protein n=1 Tax=Calorimonas adulescens TaxID=2606906 RepID=A0A5D8QGG4_9THEO|nr:nucleoside recognition domain-containing protein [Calorimonas adulescens]TZE82613.1 nucleoside recognition protein [Calorimonas adulescens]